MNTEFKDLPSYFNNGDDVLKFGNGGIYKFYQSDTRERYEENLDIMPEDWYYRTNDVVYKLNSHGYRTKEFNEIDWKESIVLFGCSNVFGVGVDESETMPVYLSQYFNRNVVNMGMCAASNELLLFNSIKLKKAYGIPWAIIFVWTCFERSTYFCSNKIIHLGAWNFKEHAINKIWDDNLYEMLQVEWANAPIKTHYSIECANEIWNKETRYFATSFFPETANYGRIVHLPYYDKNARDLSHPGKDAYKLSSEFIYNAMKNKSI